MNPAQNLRRRIEEKEIEHPFFATLHAHLCKRIDEALDGFEFRIETILGPSRVGKTMLARAVLRRYPATKTAGVRVVPVLLVTIPSNISPMLLPQSVLGALGVPFQNKGLTTGLAYKRMIDQLKLASTRVIIFEEASHLVEPGAKLPPRAAGDWFKTLADELNLTLILIGVPRLKRLFESNEQLRLRSSSPQEFRPYDMRIVHDREAFAAYVKTYVPIFTEAGWVFDVSLKTLILNCYLLSGGLPGLVSRFMQELASYLAYQPVRPLQWADCVEVAKTMESAGSRAFPAFLKEAVGEPEMLAAYKNVLEINPM